MTKKSIINKLIVMYHYLYKHHTTISIREVDEIEELCPFCGQALYKVERTILKDNWKRHEKLKQCLHCRYYEIQSTNDEMYWSNLITYDNLYPNFDSIISDPGNVFDFSFSYEEDERENYGGS